MSQRDELKLEAFKLKNRFTQDNAPSQIAKLIISHLSPPKCFSKTLMEWTPASPDINLIENGFIFERYIRGSDIQAKIVWKV